MIENKWILLRPKGYLTKKIVTNSSQIKNTSKKLVYLIKAHLSPLKKYHKIKEYLLLDFQKISIITHKSVQDKSIKNIIFTDQSIVFKEKKIVIYYPSIFNQELSFQQVIPVYKNVKLDTLIASRFKAIKEIENMIDPLENTFTIGIKEALSIVHKIKKEKNIMQQKKAIRRIEIEEMLAHLTKFWKKTQPLEKCENVYKVKLNTKRLKHIEKRLPFKIHEDQKLAIVDIFEDIKIGKNTRVLQGDVGSGKTIVAVILADQACLNGIKCYMLAPTKGLAYQHYEYFTSILPDRKISLVTSDIKKNNNTSDIIIGTHAIISKSSLEQENSIVIIDEQQKFGVQQKYNISKKAIFTLSMSATPIPRTLAMSVFASSISIINRKKENKILTYLISDKRRSIIIEKVKNFLSTKQQVYWITTNIKGYKGAEQIFSELKEKLYPYQVGKAHGKMKDSLENIQKFRQGIFDVIVATCIVEVGLHVPNANLVVIENSHKLGLSQLHQIRGRIGREKQGICIIIHPEDNKSTRLINLSKTNDCFLLSMYDLIERGIGHITGTKQSGKVINFKFIDKKDANIIQIIKAASKVLEKKEGLDEYTLDIIRKRWLS